MCCGKLDGDEQVFSGVLRSKGWFQIAEEVGTRWIWSSSFSTRTVRQDFNNAPDDSNSVNRSVVEIVFIGIQMKESETREALRTALVTNEEWSKCKNVWRGRQQPHPFVVPEQNKGETSIVVNK